VTAGVFFLVLASAFCHAGWNFAARRVAGNLAVLWLGLTAATLCLTLFALYLTLQVGVAAIPSLAAGACVVATGVLHALYFILLARAYEHGEISLVYPVARGSGIGLTAVLGWALLREPITPVGAAGILLVFAGIVVMGWPGRLRGDRLGMRLALGVGIVIPAYSIVDKIGVSLVHPVLYIWFMFVIFNLLNAPAVLRRHWGQLRDLGRRHLAHLLVVGFGSMGTYLIILFAFRLGPVSYIVAVREVAVVVGAGLGIVFLHERLTRAKAVAIIAIVIGLVAIKLA